MHNKAQPEPPRGLHIGTWVFFAKAHCCASIYFNLPKFSKVFLHNGLLQKHKAPMGLQPIPLIHRMNLTSIFKFAIFDQSTGILPIQIHASSKKSLSLLPLHNFFSCEKHFFTVSLCKYRRSKTSMPRALVIASYTPQERLWLHFQAAGANLSWCHQFVNL